MSTPLGATTESFRGRRCSWPTRWATSRCSSPRRSWRTRARGIHPPCHPVEPGESLAEEFAADPTSFSLETFAIVARTEGLALPESWSERSAAPSPPPSYVDDGSRCVRTQAVSRSCSTSSAAVRPNARRAATPALDRQVPGRRGVTPGGPGVCLVQWGMTDRGGRLVAVGWAARLSGGCGRCGDSL